VSDCDPTNVNHRATAILVNGHAYLSRHFFKTKIGKNCSLLAQVGFFRWIDSDFTFLMIITK
jgi:hypothetical protein